MADNTEKEKKSSGFPDVKQHNEEVARKLADQDAAGHSTALTAEDLRDTGGALDKLAEAHGKKAEGEETETVVEPTAEEKAKAEADAKAKEEAQKIAPIVEPTAEEKAKAEADAKAKEEVQKKADEFFKDAAKLPPNASPKSSEAFSQIKIKAAQEISARDAALETLKKEKADLEEKVKNVPPAEALKELEELRQWRAKLDIEANPRFAEFDKRVSSNHEFIYAQLKKSPVITDAVIAEIKKHGGPEAVNMDKIFESIKDPSMQRIIEARLSDIEVAKYEKEQAIAETKKNISSYLDEQRKANVGAATAHNDATKTHFSELAVKLPWFKEQTVDAKADEATKKSTEAHNAFVKQTREQLEAALQDDTPEMRAVMLAGMAQLMQLQRVHAATQAELDSMKKQLTEATDKLERVKVSGTRLRESGASPTTKTPPAKESEQFHKRAGDALDDIAKQVMEERARAAGTAS